MSWFLFFLCIGLCTVLFFIFKKYLQVNKINQNLESSLSKYSAIIDLEKYVFQQKEQADKLQSKISMLNSSLESLTKEHESLKKEVDLLEEKSYLEEYAYYEKKYDYENSGEYKEELESNREQQKNLITNNDAAICHTTWTVEGSERNGEKMIKDQLKLMLRAFNGECDAAISKVKYNNIETLKNRINKAYERINRMGKVQSCFISSIYLTLKIEELELNHEFQIKKQDEKEEQRVIREQMREEERAQREIEKARDEAEKEEKRYKKALEEAQNKITKASQAEKLKLEQQIIQLNTELTRVLEEKERAISRAQLTKSGYVYIISNIGSFGENIYKIGMTRRLEPIDRVKELGDASVPFPFDVHAMIYSRNAPKLESELHRTFHTKRLNKINERKEFFAVSLNEISEAAMNISSKDEDIHSAKIHFTLVAEAAQYRESLAKAKVI